MANFVVFDTNGRIIRSGVCTVETDISMQAIYPGETSIEITEDFLQIDSLTTYMSNDLVTIRPVAPSISIDKTEIIANGVDMAMVTGLPNPTSLLVLGTGTRSSFQISDGIFQLSSEAVGEFRLNIDPFPYRFKEIIINAT